MAAKALERRIRRGKNGIQLRTFPFPLLLKGRYRKVRFRLEKVIETPFFDPSLFADLINRRRAIGTRPDEFADGFHQSHFGIADTAHNLFSRLSDFFRALARTRPLWINL